MCHDNMKISVVAVVVVNLYSASRSASNALNVPFRRKRMSLQRRGGRARSRSECGSEAYRQALSVRSVAIALCDQLASDVARVFIKCADDGELIFEQHKYSLSRPILVLEYIVLP